MRRRDFLYVSALAGTSITEGQVLSQNAEVHEFPLAFHVENGRFRFGSSPDANVGIEGARIGVDVNGTTLWSDSASHLTWDGPASGEVEKGQRGRLGMQFGRPQVICTVEFIVPDNGQSATMTCEIRNASDSAIKVGRCRLVDTSDRSGSIKLGPSAENTVLLAMSGWQVDSRVRSIRSDADGRSSKIVAQLYNPASQAAIQLGFITLDRMNTEHEFQYNSDGNVLSGSSYCDFKGFSVAPGGSVRSERLLLQVNRDPYGSLDQWALAVQAEYHPPIWPKIPAGWLGVSWVDPLDVERWDEILHRNTRAMRERLSGMDIEYIWVSFGNLEGLQPGNWLSWNTDEFPAGHEALVDELKSRGFQLGFWIGPFWLNAHLTKLAKDLHDAFLRRNGKPMVLNPSEWGEFYVLDPTHPKTHAYLTQVFSTYRKWGIRYYMIDFLNAISGLTVGSNTIDGYYDKSAIPGPQAFREGLRVIREAAGP
ncbi:MAG: hypothetical protein JO150_07505, partial [Acidobacteriaceae bacterium]|nr:hypothetical protein [Acidobacteriaceae bacterium]